MHAAGVLSFKYANVFVICALIVGFLSIGPGGRLVMRLLAVTSSDKAQGKITEASEVVGNISFEGTVALFLFGGVAFGIAMSFAYFLIRRWLPVSRFGGILFGAMVLIVFGTHIDPLRADNLDFRIVGPSWIAVVTYATLALASGAFLAASAGRVSQALPLISRRRNALLAYAPLLALALFPPFVLVFIGGLGVALLAMRFPRLVAIWNSRAIDIAGRVAIGLIVVLSIPSFVLSINEILSTEVVDKLP